MRPGSAFRARSPLWRRSARRPKSRAGPSTPPASGGPTSTLVARPIDNANNRRESESAELARELATLRDNAKKEFAAETQAAESDRQTLRKTAIARHRRRHDEATKGHEAARWEAGTIFENAERGANDWRKDSLALLADETQAIKVLKAETELTLASYGRFTPPLPAATDEVKAGEAIDGDPFPALHAEIESAVAGLVKLEKLGLPGGVSRLPDHLGLPAPAAGGSPIPLGRSFRILTA